jgi:RimJ/RimL family protein N-acetyltransferase
MSLIDLQFFKKEDIPLLLSWIDSQEFLLQWSGMSMKHPLNVEQLEQYVKRANQEHSDVLAYKAVDRESGKTIGHISLGSINRDNGTARMCRVLIGDKSMLGKGSGMQMVTEALKIAFEQLKLHKVSLAVFDFNVAAIKIYEKVGFITEGVIREACRIKDDYWSYYEMSILDREWRQQVARKQD